MIDGTEVSRPAAMIRGRSWRQTFSLRQSLPYALAMLLGAGCFEVTEMILDGAGLDQGRLQISPTLEILGAVFVLTSVLLAGVVARLRATAERATAAAHRMAAEFAAQADLRLRDAIGAMSGGFALFDREGRLTIHNDQYFSNSTLSDRTDLIGKTTEELQFLLIDSEIICEDRKADPNAWLRQRMTRQANPPAAPFEQNLGKGLWISVSERITSDGGRLSIWSDISAQKAAEITLRDAIESISEGLILYDADMRVVICNHRMDEMYPKSAALHRAGNRREDLLRNSAARGEYPGIQTPEQVEAFVAHWMEQYRRGETSWSEREYADGRWIKLSHHRTSTGGQVSIHSDITAEKLDRIELQYTKEQLEIQAGELLALIGDLRAARMAADEATRTKSRFLSDMAHELRTPLNAVIGFADLIRNEVYGAVAPVRYREYIELIHDSGQHLLSLINDVLDLAKIEAGKLDVRIETLPAPELARYAERMMGEIAAKQHVTLAVSVATDCDVIRADARAIRQILLNLLSNAIKFTPIGGRVMLRFAQAEEAGVDIVVEDNGIGMTAAEIRIALEPYGQVGSNLITRTQGTGLGLPLARTLAERQGGTLTVTSEKGIGTSVTVHLPGK